MMIGGRWPALLVGALTLVTLGACVTVYHPMTGLQRPVLVDPGLRNLEGVPIRLRCIKGDFLAASQAVLLCNRVERLLSNQGAKVTVGRNAIREADDPDGSGLEIDLRARLLHKQRNSVLWILSVWSFTLIPATSEYTFAQDITVRGPGGFLLAERSLKGRFVRHFGVGYWALNTVLDRLVREPHERLGGKATEQDFSRDFYGQLSQIVYDARARSHLLPTATLSERRP